MGARHVKTLTFSGLACAYEGELGGTHCNVTYGVCMSGRLYPVTCVLETVEEYTPMVDTLP